MSHSEICPVCKGKGKLKDPENIEHSDIPCHGCQGLGWVTLQDDNIRWYPSYPVYPLPIYPNYPYEPYITYTCSASNMCKKED